MIIYLYVQLSAAPVSKFLYSTCSMQEYLPVNSVFTCAGELIYDKCPAGDGQRGVRAGRGALTSPRACAGYTP